MREAVCFVSIYIFVNIAEAVKPKSVNLALETVLQFDKKDQSADVEVLNRVQSFLDNIKHVMTSSNNLKRRSNTKDLKFTDFLLEAAEVLNSYDDKDLEDFFTVLDEQSRKYHYKGCKFYELVENNDVRRYMSNTLEQAKDTSAKTIRRYLKDVVQVISSENYNGHGHLVNLVNSLYDGASYKFEDVLKSLKNYRTRTKDSTINLEDIVSNAVRNLFFDHYTNLNDNARQQLKTEIRNYWLSSQYNGGNQKKHHYSQVHHGRDDMNKDFREVKDLKSKLRVIDVPNKFKNKDVHKNDKLKKKVMKGSPHHKKDRRHKLKKSTPKMDIDFFNFKETTRDNPVTSSEENNKKSNTKQYGITQGLINEDMSNSYEVKKPSNREKSYKAIRPIKSSDDEGTDGIDNTNTSKDSKDNKGISIDISNEKYLSKQKKKKAMKRHKKQKIGHVTYDVERRIKMKSHDYSDDDSSNKDSETDENADSNEKVINPKETVQEDLDESGVLIGGQNVHKMKYRAEHTPKASKRKGKYIAAEHSDDSNLQVSTKKSNNRQKSHHKSSKKSKGKKKTTVSDADEETTMKASKVKASKDSGFASSHEGMTIETFENAKESENKYSNLRKANKLTTKTTAVNNVNVHKRIHNLEKQMEDVKERMKLVLSDKTNITAADAQINAKGKESDRKIDDAAENAQTDAKIDEVSLENDKVDEIRVNSKPLNNSDTKTTNIITKSDTTTVEYETDGETKSSRTTTQIANDETKNIKEPAFRSDLTVDNIISQESNENDTIIISTLKDREVTQAIKEHITTKTDVLNDTTTLNATADSIFKTSKESDTTLGFNDPKNGKEKNISTNDHEEIKTKTSLEKDVEKDDVPTITTVVDLTKHLKDSDTVVVNMKDKGEKNIVELKENTNEIDNLRLPNPPFFGKDKLGDPLNDVDVDLDMF